MLAMQQGRGAGQVYLIADEHYFPIRDLVVKVGEALGKPVSIWSPPLWPLIAAGHIVERVCKPFGINPPIFPRRVDWFRQVRAFRIDKARRELGYQPRIGLEEGLRRTAQWYQKHGYLS
jgi:nucleoside-diphosphate-sugar epimerase